MAASSDPARAVAVVRLEVRVGSARPTVYEVGDGGFLIGSVPGCDLRLPGVGLPPVLCLIARQPTGAKSKLAPVQPVSVNGRPVSSTYLADGDRVSVGLAELTVSLSVPEEAGVPASPLAQLEERLRLIEARESALREQAERVEAESREWESRSEQVKADYNRQVAQLADLQTQTSRLGQELTVSRGDLEQRELLCRQIQDEFTRKLAELEERQTELTHQEGEIAGLRQELTRLRHELSERFGQRRDRILAQQQSLRRAARKIQLRKRAADERILAAEEQQRQMAMREQELEARAEQVARERQLLDEQHGLLSSRQQESQRDYATRLRDLDGREKALAAAETALEKGQKQHQADLVRLDRIQAGIEHRQKQLEQRALEVDRKFEQLQRDTRDLEEQAAQLDEQHTKLSDDISRIEIRQKEIDGQSAKMEQRAATLEGQQTMLATLRTRLERMREDLHRQEQALSDQRVLQEAGEADLTARRAETEKALADLTNDRQMFEQERKRFEERRTTLEQAVAQLRQTQEALALEQVALQTRQQEVETAAAEQAEQASILLTRGEQLAQLTTRNQTERQALQDRQANLTKAEQMLAALQEQVRRRVQECDTRQQDLDRRNTELQAREKEHAEYAERFATEAEAAQADLDRLRGEVATHTATLEQRRAALAADEEAVANASAALIGAEEALNGQRQALAAERVAFEVERQAALEQQRQAREEFEQSRDEAQMLVRLLPDLELRARTSLQGLERAREQLREHLTEIHSYSKQSREDLESSRQYVQGEQERVQQQDLELRVARDEHRLAVAAFRQQLIEWQGRVNEMRHVLTAGNSQLELRQAEMEERARQMEGVSARLAQEAQILESERRQVAERRGEVDRHLIDMREWYRRKIRELAGVDAPIGEPGEGDLLPLPPGLAAVVPSGDRNPSVAVLTLTEDLEPADRELGELLTRLGLIDDDTRQALWIEARQRRSLRQLLLAGGYLTLYQLALIEAGNLDGLVLGPVRVIDKLSSGPREAVYRVFDPRRNAEAVLRHLAESEMQDAVRPDEFRQRFLAAAAIHHDLIAEVLEVLTVADRPAVLVEWVNGIPAADLPVQVSVPGVWYRLVNRAALALSVAHGAGLCHGRLDSNALILTPAGTFKLVGLGEPPWLSGPPEGIEDTPASDLLALGRLAAAWVAPVPGTKTKTKGLPEELQAVLDRLLSEDSDKRFASADDLLTALDAAGSAVSGGATVWEKLLRQVREQVGGPSRRQSA